MYIFQPKKFSKLKIRSKVITFYSILLLVALSTNFIIFNYISNRAVKNEINNSATQLLAAVNNNLKLTLNSVDRFIRLTFYTPLFQEYLVKASTDEMDVATKNTIERSLTNITYHNDLISSVIVFDNNNRMYSNYGGRNGVFSLNYEMNDIRMADWYDEVINLNGASLWIKGSGGVLTRNIIDDKTENYISLVTVINNANTLKKIAIVMVIVDESTLVKVCNDILKQTNSDFIIIDEKGDIVIKSLTSDFDTLPPEIKGIWNQTGSFHTAKIDGKEKIVTCMHSDINKWNTISLFSLERNSKVMSDNVKAYLIIGVLNIFLILVSAYFITSTIINPIAGMEKYMMMAEKGNFIEIPYDRGSNDEISHLKKVFNHMIKSINKLIEKVKEEEKIIRQREFNLIQSQVNPHFLYNTLDAISSLALQGNSQETFKLTKALGNFYRISLSSGRELISVREEIECIKNYLTILNIRYSNQIVCEYKIDEDIMDCMILKLILQPIVENAVHRGIRKKNGIGKITIVGYLESDEIIFSISDDGVGMSEDRIQQILNGNRGKEYGGFGVYSSIQRISIYYGIQDPVYIISEPGHGTEVIIRVKALYEEEGQ